MRPSGWIIFGLATAVFAAVALIPGAMAVIEMIAGASAGVGPRDPWKLLVLTVAWAGGIAIGAIILGWWPARVLGGLAQRRGFIPAAACCLVPICLPPYVIFWIWWSAWPADSVIHRWAIEHDVTNELRTVSLAVALLLWSWPIAALIISASMASTGRALDELVLIDGAPIHRRVAARIRAHSPALLIAGTLIFLAIFNDTTAFDLGNIRTYGNELRALEDESRATPRDVLVAGWPALVIVLACIALLWWKARRPTHDDATDQPPRIGIIAPVASAILILVTLAVPLMILLTRRIDLDAAWDVVRGYRRAALHTTTAAAIAAAIGAGIALACALAWSSARRVVRNLTGMQALLWIIAAAVPAMIIWASLEATFNRQAFGLAENVYAKAPIIVIAYLARFGFIAALIGAWLAWRESRELRDLRAIDGATGIWSYIIAHRPRVIAALAATFILVAVLSIGEIALSSQLAPARFELIAPILLNNMHYQRDEMVIVMALFLFALAAAAAIGVAIAWSAASLRFARSAIALLFVMGALISGCEDADPLASEPLRAEITFGHPGRTLGQFIYPRAIDIDPHRELIYIIDRSGRIQRFGFDGEPDLQWMLPEYDNGYPTGVTVASDGRIFVADTHEHRVSIFDQEGALLGTFGEFGEGPGQFIFPCDVAFGPDGRIFVSEFGGNDRVQVFDHEGTFLFAFGAFGSERGEFNRPQSLTFSHDGAELFVADSCNHRVQVFDPEGNWLRSFGSIGTEPGQFRYPYGVEALDDDLILVTEFGNGRLQIMSSDGDPLAVLGRMGEGPGELRVPWAASSSQDRIFVLDSGNNRVQVIERPRVE